MRILDELEKRKTIRVLKALPNSIETCQGEPAKLLFEKSTEIAACLKCEEKYCINYSSKQVKTDRIKEFPEDRDTRICPVNAINWNDEMEIPEINSDLCIGCGLCVSACPTGAISLDVNGAKINYSSNSYKEVEYTMENVSAHKKQIKTLHEIGKNGTILDESDEVFSEIYKKILDSDLSPDKFVRNLFISLGNNSAVRRVGDVYVRMDAIYNSPQDTFGAIEVEFGGDTLEATRAILDDVAVLHSRYKINKDKNKPALICLSLPNMRQGYWQVVKDIMKVEGLKINILSLGALLLLLWNHKKLELSEVDFYADYDQPTIRNSIEEIIGREVNISENLLGILEPNK